MTDNSCVYGLRHQARCLTPVTASTEQSKFLVGTVGAKNNILCELNYDDETSIITSTSYEHPEEIWDIASCPTDEQLVFTCHSSIRSNQQRKATLWQKSEKDDDTRILNHRITLDQPYVKKVLWDPTKDNTRVAFINKSHIHLTAIENGAKNELSIDVSSTFSSDPDAPALRQLQNAVWNPHQPELVTVGDRSLSGWDLRSGESTFLHQSAHKSTIRAVDYNVNKPYHVVTGGDDAQVRIWDVRNFAKPALVVEGHTHWIWSVALNKFHDQLLLTSSSDTLVKLHTVVSVSSASYLRDQNSNGEDFKEDDEDRWNRAKPSDGLIRTYDQHEDSVYSVAWSQADTWTFASLSYAGRIIISQVPTAEKFGILGV
ncbi:Protein tssc1 [Apophysomyces ossiformis]|uniref:Protein tssc1 n=1 Tax=Apophysomyces ossiformis TaxID=679940 RepID=A0A8H7BV35_9FUNG|nr:Protein tssc1 [Apophysomyces ossiformis]